jgi:signal transduction histidine kinase
VHLDDREHVRANAIAMLKGLSSHPYEYRVTRKDGETRWILETVVPIEYQGSRAVCGYFMDITERREAQERLYHAGRLASIGEMAAGVAHELNTPLTSVLGYAELLETGGLPAEVRADIAKIRDNAQRAAMVVRNLLSFARPARPQRAPLQLNDEVRNVLNLRAYELRVSNIEIETHLDPHLPLVLADSRQVQQVFLNILVNAEQAVLSRRKQGRVVIRTIAENGSVRVSFADDGPGMRPEHLARLFKPFFTTKESGKGTGLGLSISHSIVSEHGGRIWAESAYGKGSTFFVELAALGNGHARARPAAVSLQS